MQIADKIQKLKKEKNAVILAHYYAPAEVQAIADYVGDSFYLAKVVQNEKADTIVFCGVEFMGESAKILNPEKTVLMPDLSADCAMAHMAYKEEIDKIHEEYEDVAVACYINSTAALKCLSDVCVTSANAVKIVEALPNKNVYFIPDGNLGRYVKEQVKTKNVILGSGYCPIHTGFDADELMEMKAKYPNAQVLTHPECKEDIVSVSDYIGSTSGIISYAEKSDCNEFIICTEKGVEYELKKRCPEKMFYFIGGESCICKDMKLNTLEKLCSCLEKSDNVVEVSNELRERALLPLRKMLELAK